ncbi:inorganic pyrophosphatase [Acidihalobacter yilgarnensis]|uniref:Inorganic pyrophosphatase n=1 Tax=Acidihalobacter yilgarnensis TaxID=2819280 RepID=A0A1D8IQM2_9GAMM|nr:inorganic diphosphatase [Acidihalobacter yilgarnensis]AOU98808.1 inorganic pyrophosphatase [Acidihalobacter yilgarnensis]
MNLANLPAGEALPDDFNVVIEIPALAPPVKYEIDKDSGALMVDRFMGTSMVYPCNYGFIPHTLSEDGDPVDVLVVTPIPLYASSVIRCRPVGMLQMTDEKGPDAKIIAVPVNKLYPGYAHIQSPADLPEFLLGQIQHFFEQYKALEVGKWVKVDGIQGLEAARAEILASAARAKG